MYRPRRTERRTDWEQADGIKRYAIAATDAPVQPGLFEERLARVKQRKDWDWSGRPAFAIFHAGATGLYLVLAWWDNDNELFVSVSFRGESGDWVEDPLRHSFCLYDLEVIWAERQAYIDTLHSGRPDLSAYRAHRLPHP